MTFGDKKMVHEGFVKSLFFMDLLFLFPTKLLLRCVSWTQKPVLHKVTYKCTYIYIYIAIYSVVKINKLEQ